MTWIDFIHSNARKDSEKKASFGDIVDSGLRSMAMGSPYAPQYYEHGTNNLKPTDQLQKEQKNSIVGGVTGAAIGGAAFSPAPYLAAGRYGLKGLRFLWPYGPKTAVKRIFTNPTSVKTLLDAAHYSELAYALGKKLPDVKEYVIPSVQAAMALSDVRHELALADNEKGYADKRIGDAEEEARRLIDDKSRSCITSAHNAVDSADSFIDGKIVGLGKKIDDKTVSLKNELKNKSEKAVNIGDVVSEKIRRKNEKLFSDLRSSVSNKIHSVQQYADNKIRNLANVVIDSGRAKSDYEKGGLTQVAKGYSVNRLGEDSIELRKRFSDTLPYYPRHLMEVSNYLPGLSYITKTLDNGYIDSNHGGLTPAVAYPYGFVKSLPWVSRIISSFNDKKHVGNGKNPEIDISKDLFRAFRAGGMVVNNLKHDEKRDETPDESIQK